MWATTSSSAPTVSATAEARQLSGELLLSSRCSLQTGSGTVDCSRLLLEMNHEVRGEARQESVDQVCLTHKHGKLDFRKLLIINVYTLSNSLFDQ